MNKKEADKAPKSVKKVPMKGKGCEDLTFTMSVSPLDCMGCTLCVGVCPAKEKALVMKSQESQVAQQQAFDYTAKNVTEKDVPFALSTVKGSQVKQPLLEFSGSCAGFAETSYARFIKQIVGVRMYRSISTGGV